MKEDSHARDLRQSFFHQFHPLPRQLVILGGEPGGIPARSGEARDEAEPYGVGDDRHDDRDCGRRVLGGHRCLAARDDDVYLKADQIGSEAWEAFVSSLRPPVLDADVSPVDIAKLAKPLLERFDKGGGRRTRVEHTDARDLPCLLRLGGERRGEDTNGAGEEGPPSDHWMTSSAPRSSDGGIVRPRALAVLRLITKSNFVGCSTGRSAGLAPLRILST